MEGTPVGGRGRRDERAKLVPPAAEEQESDYRQEFRNSSWAACIKRIYEINPLECPPSARAQVEGKCKAQMRIVAFIQDAHSIKNIMKAQGIPDFFIRRRLGVVGPAPPPIPKFVDAAEAIDELPSYDSFDSAPEDF